MRADLRRDLTAALKARDRVTVTALRSVLAAIDNAGATPVEHASGNTAAGEHVAGAAVGVGAAEAERRHLTDADLRWIVQREIRERFQAATEYDQLGRTDAAERLRQEAQLLDRYL